MKILCKNKHWKPNEDYNIDKILYLLIDRPNRINFYTDFIWNNKKGLFHRNYDLPAIIHNSYISWNKDGMWHRENNKPAVIYDDDGYLEYYTNGYIII